MIRHLLTAAALHLARPLLTLADDALDVWCGDEERGWEE